MSSGHEGLPRLAIAVLILECALEAARIADPYAGLPGAVSIAIHVALGSLWLFAAIAIARAARSRRRAIRLGRLAWASLALSGLVETLRGAPDGSAHLVAGMIVALAIESLAGTIDDRSERALVTREG